MVAGVPLNVTLVAFASPAPLIVTVVPIPAPVGAKVVMVGGWTTVKPAPYSAVPPGVVTAIGPVDAPCGTTHIIRPAESLVMLVADVELNDTTLAFARFAPVIVTDVPTGPLTGVKALILGIGVCSTVNAVVFVAVPPAVVTVTVQAPTATPAGTVTLICVEVSVPTLVAATPPNVMLVAFARPVPSIVTLASASALAGETLVIVGIGMTTKLAGLVAMPYCVVTATGPVVAPAGTTHTI